MKDTISLIISTCIVLLLLGGILSTLIYFDNKSSCKKLEEDYKVEYGSWKNPVCYVYIENHKLTVREFIQSRNRLEYGG